MALAVLPLAFVLMSCWYCCRIRKTNNNEVINEIQITTEPQTPQTPQSPKILITDLASLQSFPNLNQFFMATPKLERPNAGSQNENDYKVVTIT
jgi:hypothetical protein